MAACSALRDCCDIHQHSSRLLDGLLSIIIIKITLGKRRNPTWECPGLGSQRASAHIADVALPTQVSTKSAVLWCTQLPRQAPNHLLRTLQRSGCHKLSQMPIQQLLAQPDPMIKSFVTWTIGEPHHHNSPWWMEWVNDSKTMALVSSAAPEDSPVTVKGQELRPPNSSLLLNEWCPRALFSVLAANLLYKLNLPLHLFGQVSTKLTRGTNFLIFEV